MRGQGELKCRRHFFVFRQKRYNRLERNFFSKKGNDVMQKDLPNELTLHLKNRHSKKNLKDNHIEKCFIGIIITEDDEVKVLKP